MEGFSIKKRWFYYGLTMKNDGLLWYINHLYEYW